MWAYCGALEAERLEELQVQRHGRDPLLAADDEVDPHQVVVDGVREVVGRQARAGVGRLQDDHVVAVRLVLQLGRGWRRRSSCAPPAAGREPGSGRRTGVPSSSSASTCRSAASRQSAQPAVVAGRDLGGLLPRGDVGELLLRREVDVRLALAQQLPRVGEVDLLALRLAVRAVAAVLARCDGGRSRRGRSEVGEGAVELLERALDLAGRVGVLDPDDVDAAGVGGDVSGDHRRRRCRRCARSRSATGRSG